MSSSLSSSTGVRVGLGSLTLHLFGETPLARWSRCSAAEVEIPSTTAICGAVSSSQAASIKTSRSDDFNNSSTPTTSASSARRTTMTSGASPEGGANEATLLVSRP